MLQHSFRNVRIWTFVGQYVENRNFDMLKSVESSRKFYIDETGFSQRILLPAVDMYCLDPNFEILSCQLKGTTGQNHLKNESLLSNKGKN